MPAILSQRRRYYIIFTYQRIYFEITGRLAYSYLIPENVANGFAQYG